MAKPGISPRERGTRSAYVMLRQLERGLSRECDPGYSTEDYAQPMRNVVYERLTALASDDEREGFCLALNAYLAIVSEGSVPAARELQRELNRRLDFDDKLAAARDDAPLQRILATAA